MPVEGDRREIVIIGGGIIGCTTAYFLTRHPSYNPSLHKITILEATKIAGGASGKAGGLLALWAYPSSIVPLSYRLHAQLAKEHGGAERWGYRQIHCGQLEAKGRALQTANGKINGNGKDDSVSLQKRSKEAIGTLRAAGIPKDLDWFSAESVKGYDEMGDPDTTAQVHPYQFTMSMAQLAEEKGAKVILGSVKDINYASNAVKSVTYKSKETFESHTIPATDVILSAGPWTSTIYPTAPISALRAHSVTIRPSRPVSAYAIFTEISLPANFGKTNESIKAQRRNGGTKTVTPEIYARPNNEVYACGEGDTYISLPTTSDLVQVDESRCQDVVDYIASISDEMRDGEVTARQACYLPEVHGAVKGPLVGETGVKGLLMAAGHSCWGIQNSAGTGKVISEFVFDGKAQSASIGGLDPRKALR
ncbi:MAG: hypothetical protein M1827_003623 [Pycnora praestabilis]|nr:MAG: hypothetical protein M1827_003623 [Pycnora praestabilis]